MIKIKIYDDGLWSNSIIILPGIYYSVDYSFYYDKNIYNCIDNGPTDKGYIPMYELDFICIENYIYDYKIKQLQERIINDKHSIKYAKKQIKDAEESLKMWKKAILGYHKNLKENEKILKKIKDEN